MRAKEKKNETTCRVGPQELETGKKKKEEKKKTAPRKIQFMPNSRQGEPDQPTLTSRDGSVPAPGEQEGPGYLQVHLSSDPARGVHVLEC